MPELPEVQTVVNDLKAAGLIGAVFSAAGVFWPRTIHGLPVRTFCRRIRGKKILDIRRRGKYIRFDLTQSLFLFVHLRMTGRFLLSGSDLPRARHEHVVLNIGGRRQLRFHDTRKFGRFYLTRNPDDIVGHLGPEPLDPEFTPDRFSTLLGAHRRQIKPLLLDQTFLAGLGNIYVDEALWEARIHPQRNSAVLDGAAVCALHQAIIHVLRKGLENMGTTLGTGQANFYSVAGRRGRNRDRLNVFRRRGLPCPRCRADIVRMTVGQRSTFVCPACQPL